MEHVKAFVGHSFHPEDEVLVRSFLKLFDSISNASPTFSWVHAEAARPLELRTKVLELVRKSNTFIGICTKRELVADQKSFSTIMFDKISLKIAKDELQWKTTDWIIQEIGLAIGREMELILLIEEGLRLPGGMQGNIERIEFNRQAPERSHRKIIEMIGALSPKPTRETNITADSKESTQIETETATKASSPTSALENWRTPNVRWKRFDYEHAFFMAVIEKDEEAAERIGHEYKMTEAGSSPEESKRWEVRQESIRIRFGKGGSMARLKELALNAQDADMRYDLAAGYEHFEQHEEAAEQYFEAARSEESPDKQLTALRLAAVELNSAGKRADVEATLDRMRNLKESHNLDGNDILFAQLRIAETTHHHDLELSVREQLLTQDPSENNDRFQLAFKYANLKHNSLALLHYRIINSDNRTEFGWNNLGAVRDELALPARAVDAYRRAQDMGNTLAMRNLAMKFSTAGFLEEAQKIGDAALKIPDHDSRVDRTVAMLKEVREKESKQEEEVVKRVRPTSEFYSKVGRETTRKRPDDLPIRWRGPDCEVEAVYKNGRFVAKGQFKKSASSIVGIFGSSAHEEVYNVEYCAEAIGKAFFGKVKKRKDGSVKHASLLLGNDDEWAILMYVDDTSGALNVMEKLSDDKMEFYSLIPI